MPANYEQLLKQGDALTNQGKFGEALEQYSEARNLDPARPEAHKQIVNIAIKKEDFEVVFQEYLDWSEFIHARGKLDDALKILQEAMSLDGQHERRGFLERRSPGAARLKEYFGKFSPRIYEALGEIYYEKKDYDNAINFLDKAVEASQSNTKAYALLGLSYMAKGQLDKAKGPFQEVVRFAGPEAALAYEKLADIYSNQGNMTQMVIWLKDAAEAYLRQDNFKMAVKALERILEVEKGNEEVLKHLAEIYVKERDVENAVRVYKQLAQIYSEAGLFDKVIVLYEKLVEWEPQNLEIVKRIIEIYRMSLNVDSGNLRARIKLIENLLRTGATEEVVVEYLHLVDNYIKIGLLDEAISCCQSILQLEPTNIKAREVLADLYSKTGKSEEAGKELVALVENLREKGDENKAAQVIQKAVTIAPEKGELHLKLAQDYLQTGEMEEALHEFQKVLESDSDHSEALWQVGKIFFDRKQLDAAADFLERLLQKEPKHFEAKTKLEEIYEARLLREMEEFSGIAG